MLLRKYRRALLIFGIVSIAIGVWIAVMAIRSRGANDRGAGAVAHAFAEWSANQTGSDITRPAATEIAVEKGEWVAILEPYSENPTFLDAPSDAAVARVLAKRSASEPERTHIVIVSGNRIVGIAPLQLLDGPPLSVDGTCVWRVYNGHIKVYGRFEGSGKNRTLRLVSPNEVKERTENAQ